MAQQQNNPQSDTANINGKDKKSSEPLFGPSIGPVSSGPAWTIGSEKKVVTDELTPDIVNSWIEKSKEVSFFFPRCFLWCTFSLARYFFAPGTVLSHFSISSSRRNPQLLYKLSLTLSVQHYASRRCHL